MPSVRGEEEGTNAHQKGREVRGPKIERPICLRRSKLDLSAYPKTARPCPGERLRARGPFLTGALVDVPMFPPRQHHLTTRW